MDMSQQSQKYKHQYNNNKIIQSLKASFFQAHFFPAHAIYIVRALPFYIYENMNKSSSRMRVCVQQHVVFNLQFIYLPQKD